MARWESGIFRALRGMFKGPLLLLPSDSCFLPQEEFYNDISKGCWSLTGHFGIVILLLTKKTASYDSTELSILSTGYLRNKKKTTYQEHDPPPFLHPAWSRR